MNPQTLNVIIKAVQHAREKHPRFAFNETNALCLAQEELGEMAKAINDGDFEHAKEEAMDTIAVLVRYVEEL